MMTSNRTVLDLGKVQYASFFYRNQEGSVFYTKPKAPTVRGQVVGDEIAHFHPLYPGETMLERAKRMDILDRWTPVCVLQLTANHYITYTGKKAVSIWKAWREKIYGPTNKATNPK